MDWGLARSVGHRLSPSGPKVSRDEAADTVADLRARSATAAGLVAEVTGLVQEADARGAVAEVVDRRGWIDLNVTSFRATVGPLLAAVAAEAPPPPPGMHAVGRTVTGVELGGLLALLSGRVLGQFEALAADPGRLVLVAPNIVATERAMEVDPGEFRLWVAVHEVAHRTQFAAAPWLRDYVLGQLQEMFGGGQLAASAIRSRLAGAVGEVLRSVRDDRALPSLVDLVQTPEQRLVMDRVTAVMSVLEGHAEHVMNAVPESALPSVAEIQQRFAVRRQSVGTIGRVLRQLVGLDAKMRQYADGARFVAAVVDEAGMATVNELWRGPEMLPTLDELHDPASWVRRVGA